MTKILNQIDSLILDYPYGSDLVNFENFEVILIREIRISPVSESKIID